MELKWLIIVVGFVYAAIGVEQFLKGSVGNAIVYTGYAFSNAGLFMLAK
jgi:hypothetical protein